jgi:DNA-binding transcriptional regulator YhcF (GntR family)
MAKEKQPQIKSKVQRKVGIHRLIDSETKKLVDVSLNLTSNETDFGFHKTWLQDLTNLLLLIGGQKVKVLNHILLSMDRENTFIGTVRGMSEKLNLSVETVTKSIKILKDSGYLKMLQNGIYMVNPDLIIRGGSTKRQIVKAKFEGKTPPDKIMSKTKISKKDRELAAIEKAYDEKTLNEARLEMQIEEAREKYGITTPRRKKDYSAEPLDSDF